MEDVLARIGRPASAAAVSAARRRASTRADDDGSLARREAAPALRARPRPGGAPRRRHARARARTPEPSVRFGIFYEFQLPRPWGPGDEHRLLKDALEQVELADQLGLRLRVGGRAPLPRGVLALLGARGLPGRGQPADPSHPARARHRAIAGGVQPPGPGRRAHRHPRPRVRRPGRVRHGRVELGGGAGRVRRGPGHQAGPVARGPRRRDPADGRGALRRATRAGSSRCRRGTWCPSRCSDRTLRCGWRAAAATPSIWPPPWASGR